MKEKIKKALAYFKNYFYLFAAILLLAVGGIVFLRGDRKEKIYEIFKKQRKALIKEIEVIEEQEKKKEEKIKEIKEKYDSSIEIIEKKYKIKEEELDTTEKKRIKKLLEKYDADPEMLVSEIASERGWEYIE